jgi:hypothetical protein
LDPAIIGRTVTTPRELLAKSLQLGGGGGRNQLGLAGSPDHAV